MVRKIAQEAKRQGIEWVMAREGANHTIYSLDGLMIPVFEECEPTLGKGWWQ